MSLLDQRAIADLRASVRAPLSQARHLPGWYYASPEVYQREVERIFRRDWLCVARVEEIERPGDYTTATIVDEPVLLTRDEDGAIHAFANLCQHRGVQLATGCGNARRLTCRYHGWTYDLRGRLAGAAFMDQAEGFDRGQIGLKPLRHAEWAGWIFVNFDDHAPPLETALGDFARDLDFLHFERCRISNKHSTVWDCNWKFANENLSDPYHFRALHPSFGARIPLEQYTFDLRPRGGVFVTYDLAPQTPDGGTPLGPMPWLADRSPGFSTQAFLAPHVTVIGRRDEAHIYTTWPEGPDRTRVFVYHLFPKEHFARNDFAERARVYHDFIASVIEEDRSVVPELQRAARSMNFRPGRLGWLEAAVHNQQRHNVERLFG